MMLRTVLTTLALLGWVVAASAAPTLQGQTLTVDGTAFPVTVLPLTDPNTGAALPYTAAVYANEQGGTLPAGIYCFDDKGVFVGRVNKTGFAGEAIFLAPDKSRIAMAEYSRDEERLLSFYSWPPKEGEEELLLLHYGRFPESGATSLIWEGPVIYRTSIDPWTSFTDMGEPEPDPNAPTRTNPTFINVIGYDLATNRAYLSLRGTTLCDYRLLGRDGDAMKAVKVCRPTVEAWNTGDASGETREEVRVPLSKLEAAARATDERRAAPARERARNFAAAAALCEDAPVYFACEARDKTLVALCGTPGDTKVILRLSGNTGLQLPQPGGTVTVGSLSNGFEGGTYLRFAGPDADYMLYTALGKDWLQSGLSKLVNGETVEARICPKNSDPVRAYFPDLAREAGYAMEEGINFTSESTITWRAFKAPR